MSETRCPVCGKSGIPDYLSQDTVCPCCGSDLRIYRMIDDLQKGGNVAGSGVRRWRVISGIAMLATLALLVFCVLFAIGKNKIKTELSDAKQQVSALTEQVSELSSKDSPKPASQQEALAQYFNYTIQKGDCLWIISKKIYGDGSRWKEIAEKNGIDNNTVLQKGDTIKIYF